MPRRGQWEASRRDEHVAGARAGGVEDSARNWPRRSAEEHHLDGPDECGLAPLLPGPPTAEPRSHQAHSQCIAHPDSAHMVTSICPSVSCLDVFLSIAACVSPWLLLLWDLAVTFRANDSTRLHLFQQYQQRQTNHPQSQSIHFHDSKHSPVGQSHRLRQSHQHPLLLLRGPLITICHLVPPFVPLHIEYPLCSSVASAIQSNATAQAQRVSVKSVSPSYTAV